MSAWGEWCGVMSTEVDSKCESASCDGESVVKKESISASFQSATNEKSIGLRIHSQKPWLRVFGSD